MRRDLPVCSPFIACATLVLATLTMNAQTSRAAQRPNLDDEAKGVARRVLLRMLLRCGNSYYAYNQYSGGDGIEDVREIWPYFSEYRELDFTALALELIPLHPADRLNGIEWSGRVKLAKRPAFRTRENQNGDWGPWPTEWSDLNPYYHLQIELQKVSGKWFVIGDRGRKTPLDEELSQAQPSCADLPIH